jgi:hypothetical protein
MALPPFWMDDLFSGGPSSFMEALEKSKRFRAALAKAEGAYLEAQDTIDNNPGICGVGPEQAACRALLDSIGLSIND